MEQTKNIATVKPSLPAGTLYSWLCLDAYIALITHGSPRPKNTLTELEPVTLPTAASAYSLDLAAVMLAKVSGREVPMATMVIAVICGYRPTTHPIASATSPTTPVIIPINDSAMMKAGFPPPHLIGGTIAKKSFQVMIRNYIIASNNETSITIISSSLIYGPSIRAFLNYCYQDGSCVDKKYSKSCCSWWA